MVGMPGRRGGIEICRDTRRINKNIRIWHFEIQNEGEENCQYQIFFRFFSPLSFAAFFLGFFSLVFAFPKISADQS